MGGQEGIPGPRLSRGSQMDLSSLSAPTFRFSMRPRNSAIKQEPGGSCSESSESPIPSPSAEQAASGPLLPLSPTGCSQGDASHQDQAGTSGASRVDGLGPKPASTQSQQISKQHTPARFVPFSGGGQRLGGPSSSARSLTSPAAKLPKSFSSLGGPSKPKKLRPGQEPRSEPEPVRGEPGAGGPSCQL